MLRAFAVPDATLRPILLQSGQIDKTNAPIMFLTISSRWIISRMWLAAITADQQVKGLEAQVTQQLDFKRRGTCRHSRDSGATPGARICRGQNFADQLTQIRR